MQSDPWAGSSNDRDASCRFTAVPAAVDRLPGFVIVGVVAGLGVAATFMRTIFATDGTPALLSTNTM